MKYLFLLALFIPAVTNADPTINDAYYEAKLFATGLGAITGLTIDSSGALYATDYLNGRVLKFSADGTYVVYASGLTYATDLSFTQDGHLFVTSSTSSSSNVYQIGTGGALSLYASGFSFPTSIESLGNDLYVSNSGDGTISKIDATGNPTTFLSGFGAPYGISFDDAENMYFIDHGTGNVYTSDLLGNVQYLGTITPLGAIFTLPDNHGNLYVTSSLLASIYKIDDLGNMTVFASDFTGKSNPPVIGPTDMVFDEEGNMFVGDGASIWKLSLITIDVDVYPRPTFAITQDLNITVMDNAQNLVPSSEDTVTVQVTDATSGDSEDVVLTETDVNTGIFKGTVPTAPVDIGTTSGDDILNTVDGHSVVVTWDSGVAPPITASTIAVSGTTGVITVPAEIHVGDIMTIRVADADRDTDPYTPETISVTSVVPGGDSQDTILTETGPNTGIFEGSLAIEEGTTIGANDDKLTVVVGDGIYTFYIDDFDNSGATDVPVTAETTVTPTPSDTTDTTDTSNGGGGCVAGTGTAWNITMPAILAALLGYGFVRRRRK